YTPHSGRIVGHTEVTFCPDLSGGSSGTGFFLLLRLHLVRGEEPCADCPIADSEGCGDLSQAVALRFQLKYPFAVYPALRAAKLLAICSRIPNPGTHPLPYQVSLKLRHR